MMRIVKRGLLEAKDEVNTAAVADILGLPRSAVKYAVWSYTAMNASFAVITDRAARVVVLAFRGSLSDADFLTDACGKLSPFCGGHAHSGMAEMVERLLPSSSPNNGAGLRDSVLATVLLDQLAQHPDYSLWVTGHSLGAGLAQLFTVKLKQLALLPGTVPLHCYAFAPPPVLTCPLANGFDDCVTCVVGGTDVVCRLQLNSLDRLASEMSRHTALARSEPADMTEEVSLTGRILMLTKPMSKHRNWLVAVPRNHAVLHHVFVHRDMISSHLMDHYAEGLRNIHSRPEES
jgi:hypothetical protein